MKKIFPFLLALLFIVSCGNDDDNYNDLTKLIVGIYERDGSSENIIVNKIENNTVSLVGPFYAFTNVVMDSENSFTLTEYSEERTTSLGGICNYLIIFKGNGTVSETSISLFINEVKSASNPNPCPSSFYNNRNITHNGIRQ